MKLFAPLIIFIGLTYNAGAQPRLSSFNNVAVIDNLPQNTVVAMVQDVNGFLWIGSESGLLRYDGRSFEKYTAGLNRNFFLVDHAINSVSLDAGQNIWVAATEGISAFNPARSLSENATLTNLCKTINKQTGKLPAHCFYFKKDMVYIGYSFGVALINTKTGTTCFYSEIKINGQCTKVDITQIKEDNGQLLLLSPGKGLLKGNLEDGFSPVLNNLPGEGLTRFSELLVRSPGNYLVATSKGLVNVFLSEASKKEKWQYSLVPGTAGKVMTSLGEDIGQERILAGTEAYGFFVLNKDLLVLDQVKKENTFRGLSDNSIVSILPDNKGNGYWVGTHHGLCRFFYKENAFTSIPFYDKAGSPNRIYPIYTENNKDVWVGTQDGLFYVNIEKPNRTPPRLIANTNGQRFYSVAKLGNNYLLGTREGILFSNNHFQSVQKIAPYYKELSFADSSKIYCIFPLNDVDVLFAYRNDTACGLIRWNKSSRTAAVIRPDIMDPVSSKNKISNIVAADSNRVILCTNAGIVFYTPATNSFKGWIDPAPGRINYAQVSSALYEKDYLWITTYGGGLNVLNRSTNAFRYITEKNGLANNDIYAIQNTSKHHYWMSSNYGIGYYNAASGQFVNYTKNNGLLDNEYDRLSSFRCGDTLYFGGLSGFTCFNYKTIEKQEEAAGVFITKLFSYEGGKETDVAIESGKWQEFSQTQSNLRLQLSFPHYTFPENNRFYYRILPGDSNWLNIGNNHTVLLAGLSPGKHLIEARALSSSGTWSKNIAALKLFIKPYWFQTLWFRIGLVALFVTGIYLAYRIRMMQIRKEYAIKKQIAKDLHDDLGGTLSSIKLFSQIPTKDAISADNLGKIKDATGEAIAGLKDLIWTLDDDKNTLFDLLERIKSFYNPLFEAEHISFSVASALNLHAVSLKKEEKKELLMILKEAAINCIKYASCKNVRLIIEGTGQPTRFIFIDDGVGFAADRVTGGNGLRNMKSRALQIGFKTSIVSTVGKGTSVFIEKG